MCSAACASSRFLRSEAYGGSFPTTPIPGCMSYWISWALITGCTHGLQVRVSSERLEGRRLKKTTGSTGQGCEMVGEMLLNGRRCRRRCGWATGAKDTKPEAPGLHVSRRNLGFAIVPGII